MKKLFATVIFAALTVAGLLALPATAQVVTQLRLGVLNNSLSSQIRNAPTYVDASVLAANVAETRTVPTGARYVIFSQNCAAVYMKLGATAAVPAADVTDGTASELNPAAWFITGSTQISMIAPTACTITISWYLI